MAGFSRNEARIPGDSGSLVDITTFGRGPVFAKRIYAGHTWSDRHELRVLWAPLSVRVSGKPSSSISFQNKTFAADQSTEALYTFNSYRATYAYHFESDGVWRWALGFTAKIRDAEIRLTQGSSASSKTNVGFVPLLNLQLRRDLGDGAALSLDLDGMAAPQGRAFDVALTLEQILELGSAGTYTLYGGYRSIEGGADNDVVYNFAWIHQGVLGLKAVF